MQNSLPAGGPRRGLLARVADAWHRLVHSRYAEEREQLTDLTRRLDKAGAEQQELAREVRAVMTRVWNKVEKQATHRDFRGIDYRVSELEGAIGRLHHIVAKALSLAEWQEEQRVFERRLRRRLTRIGTDAGPVIVGPWSGEVGFELLYWIPFVTEALRQASIAPERIVVVSRGGTGPWYSHLGGRYVDILSHVTPDQFRARTVEKKQKTLLPFDREIVRAVLSEIGARRVSILHPGLMYPLFQPFWKQRENVGRVERYTKHQLFDAAALPAVRRRLPAEYVAVRFYFSDCFPDTSVNRAFVESVVTRLTESIDVVLLTNTSRVDDHHDYRPGRRERIHYVDDLMTPDSNLAIQSAVIAGARAFVGTYGGFAYLAPLYGVRSLAFYSDYDAFFAHHLDFAQRVFHRLGAGSLLTLDVRDADLVRLALAPEIGAAAGPLGA
jgi:hypothetical protein